jgi:hypothetical protein
MREGVSTDEMLGYFESIYENDLKIADLNSQVKALKADSSELTKITSKDFEVKAKKLKQAYQHWKDAKGGEAEEDDDLYTLFALVDEIIEKENNQEE